METIRDIMRREVQRIDDKEVLLANRHNNFYESPSEPTEALYEAHARAQPIYGELQSTPPSPLKGESDRSYRLRILDELRQYSPQHRNVSLRALSNLEETGFTAIESAILGDAAEAARTWSPSGQLRERKVTRADGLSVVEFVGSPLTWLSHFTAPARAVKRFRNGSGATIEPSRITVVR